MKTTQKQANFELDQESWVEAEKLASPRSGVRDAALDFLVQRGIPRKSPLIAYLIATRISDPDLDVRCHVIKALGGILIDDEPGESTPDLVIQHLQAFFARLTKSQILNLLEVSERSLTAEDSLISIFKICSYAGEGLSGIVNDRKIPLSIRQKAIYFSGKVGFLEVTLTLKGLVGRIEKRNQGQVKTNLKQKNRDEDQLYPYAVVALEKLDTRFAAE